MGPIGPYLLVYYLFVVVIYVHIKNIYKTIKILIKLENV